ncbi:MAG: choice-of-anchor Q domain-containing protein, partial [Geminicoccaceae bacterium]
GTGVTLINSTVTGNSTAGIYAAGGGIETSNSFFFRLSISNSNVAGNATAASPGQDIAPNPNPGSYSPGRSISSNGHNIFGSDIEGNVAGDLENVPAGLLFAGGLADHGGPTWTIALRDDPTNPALGAADPTSAPATDQRGVTRPLPGGTNPDIGAFEHAALPLDGLQYIASYEDLIRALGPDEAAGEAHYRNYGAAEGRQVGFDGLEYVASYGDLIVRLGADRDAGSSHFIRHGLDEGRRTSFDGLEYIASFADLIAALGADRAAGSRHFIEHGAAEGRQVSFDGLQYIASYGDLIQALGPNADAGAVHFIRNGEAEGRVRDEFDEVQYLRNYADLQAAFGDDIEAATRHFITYGFAEGRTDHPLAAAADFLL